MTADDDLLDLDYLLRASISDDDFLIPAASPTSPRPPIDWSALDDADAPPVWDEVREWVEWFTFRYDIPASTVPPCWYRHRPLVEELSALHTAHRAAYDLAATGHEPARWHEQLQQVLPRLRRAAGGGCPRGHRGFTPRSLADATDEASWAEWIKQSHARPPESS